MRRDAQYRLPSYTSRCDLIGIESLLRRRINLGAMFVFDVLTGRLDSPNLASKFQINVPTRTLRNDSFLVLARHRSNYGLFEPVNNLPRIFNMFAQFYAVTAGRFAFRSAVKSFALTDSLLERHGFLLRLVDNDA